jgi:hypothetical protein
MQRNRHTGSVSGQALTDGDGSRTAESWNYSSSHQD